MGHRFHKSGHRSSSTLVPLNKKLKLKNNDNIQKDNNDYNNNNSINI